MKKSRKLYLILTGVMLLCCVAGCKKQEEIPGGKGTPVPEVTEPADGIPSQGASETSDECSEAPMLQQMTASKKLPELQKRLPVFEDRYVVNGVSVGNYGEDVQFAAESAEEITGELVSEGLFQYSSTGTIAPNIAKGYTVNADFTRYTISLREGMRWSDGVLFTADDCIFFYEKMCLPETFGEPLWDCFTVKDDQGKQTAATFHKLDTYSFEIVFSQSKPDFLSQLLQKGGICFAPEHYFVNLMPAYMGEDAAKAKAKHMGYESVEEMLRVTVVQAWNIPGVPTLNPYCVSNEEGKSDVSGDYYEFVRNPYYWKVDTEGKQLPYMDRLGFTRISGESQKMLLITEGFLTVSHLDETQVAEARAAATRGKYRVIAWSNTDFYAVSNQLKNFPESYPYEEILRGIGAAHPEQWYME